jgi:hypothetical protein
MSSTQKKLGVRRVTKGLGGSSDSPFTAELPLIVSARTGLAGKDDSIVKRVPVKYAEKTLRKVLDYIITHDMTSEESGLAESLKKELESRSSIVVVNGKKAELGDNVEDYISIKNHKLSDKSTKQYRELEIEISSVQEGGFYELFR